MLVVTRSSDELEHLAYAVATVEYSSWPNGSVASLSLAKTFALLKRSSRLSRLDRSERIFECVTRSTLQRILKLETKASSFDRRLTIRTCF